MKAHSRLVLSQIVITIMAASFHAHAQTAFANQRTPSAAAAATGVPALVPYSSIALAGNGKPLSGEAAFTFQLFKDEQGGEPLWIESQMLALDPSGHYQVKLGATSAAGLPVDLFASGEGRWLEIQIAGQAPQPRVLLMSVPYAMKAADAATLNGLPASAFMLAGAAQPAQPIATPAVTGATAVTTPGGTTGYLPIFTGPATIADSAVFASGTKVGINTKTPAAALDVDGAIDARGLFTLESQHFQLAATANHQAIQPAAIVIPAAPRPPHIPQQQPLPIPQATAAKPQHKQAK